MITAIHVIESLADFGGTPKKLLYLTKYTDPAASRLVFGTFMPSALREQFESHNATVINFSSTSVPSLIWKLAQCIKHHKADVVCTHYTRPLIVGYLASQLTGVPLVHNEHSSAHYRRGIGRVLAKWILPHAALIISNSRYTRASINDAFKAPPSKSQVVYNPVEHRAPSVARDVMRSDLGIDKSDVVIGHTGGMIPQRDHETLLRAFGHLYSTHRHTKLLIVGDGPLRAGLERLAGQLGIDQATRFVGYSQRVPDYLAAMDIYVNTTLDEGFGIAVAEAMLAGLPVVLTACGAHPELIIHGQEGLLVKGGDVAELSAALGQLTDAQDLRERMGNTGQATAKRRFAPERYAKEYLALLQQVLGSSHSADVSRSGSGD